MPSREVSKLLIGIVLAPIVGWLSTTKRGKRILIWVITATVLSVGAASVVTKRFVGTRGVGIMTGTPAIVAGAVLLAVGLYLVFALVRSREVRVSRDDQKNA